MTIESMRQYEAMKDEELPFKSLINPEILNKFDKDEVEKKLAYLEALNLNPQSTADEVRRVAVSVRRKFEDDDGGINRTTFRALEWALKQTRDVIGIMEFVYFLNYENVTFGLIASERFDR